MDMKKGILKPTILCGHMCLLLLPIVKSQAQTFQTPYNDVFATKIEKYVDKDTVIEYFRNATLHSTSSRNGVSHIFLLTVIKQKDYSVMIFIIQKLLPNWQKG